MGWNWGAKNLTVMTGTVTTNKPTNHMMFSSPTPKRFEVVEGNGSFGRSGPKVLSRLLRDLSRPLCPAAAVNAHRGLLSRDGLLGSEGGGEAEKFLLLFFFGYLPFPKKKSKKKKLVGRMCC